MNIMEDQEIVKEFISESNDHLEDIESKILLLEEKPDDMELINGIFRPIHSMKGSAGFLGLKEIASFSHELETLLDDARKEKLKINCDIISLLLESVDMFKKLIGNLSSEIANPNGNLSQTDGKESATGVSDDVKALIHRVSVLMSNQQTEVLQPASDECTDTDVVPQPEEKFTSLPRSEQAFEQSIGNESKKTPFDTANLLHESVNTFKNLIGNLSKKIRRPNGNLPQADVKETASVASISDKVKTLKHRVSVLMNNSTEALQSVLAGWIGAGSQPVEEDKSKESPKLIGEILVDERAATQKEVKDALEFQDNLEFQDKKVGEILVGMGATTPDKVKEALKKQGISDKESSATVKVHINKLDNLVNLVGELVISQALINDGISSTNGNGIGKNLSQLGKITKEIQDQVMSLRMVPLKPTFQKMSRLVRDLSAKAGKKIQLEISGEDTELDKTVIEKIGDPLVHIIRNSIDHGIEPAAERIASGKPETGTIRLNAYYKGGNIIIEISDDGKGLDKNKILKKALDKGVIEEDEALTDSQIYNLIFMAGFSTAEIVTDISGRGVGMDVVKRNMEKLRGKVDIHTEKGSGTKFSIKLPLTLAIIDGMIVEVGGEKFIIPILSIEESIRPGREEVFTIQNKGEIVNIRGSLLPIVRLHEIYKIQTKRVEPWEALLVIVEGEGQRFCILVDNLVGQQQVVIKSLGDKLRSIKGVTGGAILGDGKVALILDVSGIMNVSLN